MEAIIVFGLAFGLLWVLFILPQQRRVRAHRQLVESLQVGDEIVLSAGIHGRITDVGPENMQVEVSPGVELKVARQAVLRRVENAVPEIPADEDRADLPDDEEPPTATDG